MFDKKLGLDNVLYRRWSNSAYQCYTRNCHCDGCPNLKYCETYGNKELYGMYHMKFVVIQLIKNSGKEGFEKFKKQVQNGTTPKAAGNTKY